MPARYTNHFHSQGQQCNFLSNLHPNCHCFLEVCYAIALRGTSAVPPNDRLSTGEMTLIMDDAGVRMQIDGTNYLVKK